MRLNVEVFIGIVGLMLTAATVWGAFRVSRNTTATALYRETAEAWENRARARDEELKEARAQAAKDRAEFAAKMAAKDAELADLRGRVQLLSDMVTGKSVLEEIQQRFDTRTADILGIVGTVRDEVVAMRATIAKTALP